MFRRFDRAQMEATTADDMTQPEREQITEPSKLLSFLEEYGQPLSPTA